MRPDNHCDKQNKCDIFVRALAVLTMVMALGTVGQTYGNPAVQNLVADQEISAEESRIVSNEGVNEFGSGRDGKGKGKGLGVPFMPWRH